MVTYIILREKSHYVRLKYAALAIAGFVCLSSCASASSGAPSTYSGSYALVTAKSTAPPGAMLPGRADLKIVDRGKTLQLTEHALVGGSLEATLSWRGALDGNPQKTVGGASQGNISATRLEDGRIRLALDVPEETVIQTCMLNANLSTLTCRGKASQVGESDSAGDFVYVYKRQ
jgi:hypothetical protein